MFFNFFFCIATATTSIYTLSLHDALPISKQPSPAEELQQAISKAGNDRAALVRNLEAFRSEEHTSELQSHHDLVCRPLLEKKKQSARPDRSTTPLSITVPAVELGTCLHPS